MKHSVAISALCALALLAAPSARASDDGLRLSGSIRLRHEVIAGQARAGYDSRDALTNIRTQILTEYRAGDLRFALEIYDSRAYGADPGTPFSTNEVNALEPVQAYVATDLHNLFGRGDRLTLTAGRMMLNLGSRRLVAADDYRNTTNGYTGLRADYAGSGPFRATAIYVLPQIRLPDDPQGVRDAKVRLDRENFDLVLWGGTLARPRALGPAMVELSYFHLGERDAPGRPSRDRSLDTFGGRVIADPRPGQVDYEVEAFYQRGHVSASLAPHAARLPVRAGFVHADIGYSFTGPWQPRLSAEIDWASGDGKGSAYGRFDTLFGMRRADLAPAGLYNALARTNILTPGLRLEATPNKRLDLFVAARTLWLAARRDSFSSTGVRDPFGRSGAFAGTQVEGRLRYWLIPARLRFEYDGLLLAKGRFLRDAPNAPPGRWTRYHSFNLSATF